ncbi:hypothetical protein [Paraburkholderia youngii]|uniref:hypothetical protein n=1 Tax=Paraburkholderia youngii TaxID=2782701 RepID=UPI003D1BADFC
MKSDRYARVTALNQRDDAECVEHRKNVRLYVPKARLFISGPTASLETAIQYFPQGPRGVGWIRAKNRPEFRLRPDDFADRLVHVRV